MLRIALCLHFVTMLVDARMGVTLIHKLDYSDLGKPLNPKLLLKPQGTWSKDIRLLGARARLFCRHNPSAQERCDARLSGEVPLPGEPPLELSYQVLCRCISHRGSVSNTHTDPKCSLVVDICATRRPVSGIGVVRARISPRLCFGA